MLGQPYKDHVPHAVVDIISPKVAYLHFSLTDVSTLIFDVSECDLIASCPNADGTLNAMKDGEIVILQPIKPR